MINVAKFVEGDITRFVENTVRQNREVDAQIEAQNEKTIEAYMNKFGVNVDVPDKKKTQKQKANKIAANKSADNSWLTKENLKKMWEETKRKAAEEKQRAKEEELAQKEAIKKLFKKNKKHLKKPGRKAVADKKVADVLAFSDSDKAPKAAKKVAQKNILPKSKQVIVSAKKAQKQQIAFNSNFMDKLGIKQASTKVMAKSSGKGMGADGKKYYGIWLDGKNTVVDSWAECQKQTKGVPGVEFRGFELRADAENFRGYSRESTPSVATKAPPRMSVSFLTEKPDISLEIKQEQSVELPQKLPYEVTIFTDGSCFNKSEGGQTQESGRLYPGGYAAVFLDMNQNELMRIKGGEQYTTNNRMELTAVKEALQYLDDGTRHKVHIVSDSQYVVNSFSKHWVQGWKRAGLKTGDEIVWRKSGTLEEVKNQELFKAVDVLQSKHDVDFSYTRAHVGTKTRESFYNDLCDTLAKTMSEEMSRRKNSNAVTIANSKPPIVRSVMRESAEHVR